MKRTSWMQTTFLAMGILLASGSMRGQSPASGDKWRAELAAEIKLHKGIHKIEYSTNSGNVTIVSENGALIRLTTKDAILERDDAQGGYRLTYQGKSRKLSDEGDTPPGFHQVALDSEWVMARFLGLIDSFEMGALPGAQEEYIRFLSQEIGDPSQGLSGVIFEQIILEKGTHRLLNYRYLKQRHDLVCLEDLALKYEPGSKPGEIKVSRPPTGAAAGNAVDSVIVRSMDAE